MMMESVPRHLFVYGTLLATVEGDDRPTLRGWTEVVGTGSVPGLLYDTGAYPAAVISGGGSTLVRGEIHAVPEGRIARLLEVLDAYEQYFPYHPASSLFIRTVVEATLDTGGTTAAWIYSYNRPVDRLPRIHSGDYLASRHGEGG